MLSLYDRLGGEPAIMAAVATFYDKVIADPIVGPFFRALDMPAQSRKQVAFMTWAFGGPSAYRGRDLGTAHATLVRDKGLTDIHFDTVAGHLNATLNELGLDPELVDEAMTAIAGLRSTVLGR